MGLGRYSQPPFPLPWKKLKTKVRIFLVKLNYKSLCLCHSDMDSGKQQNILKLSFVIICVKVSKERSMRAGPRRWSRGKWRGSSPSASCPTRNQTRSPSWWWLTSTRCTKTAALPMTWSECLRLMGTCSLKGKFRSGIEGALASTLNHNFNWKQLSEMILCIFLLMFSKFIWVTLIQKQQKKEGKKRILWILGVGTAFYYDLKYNRKFWRTYYFQDA